MLARSKGTHSNRRQAVGVYLAFCLRMSIPPFEATYQDICGFVEYLGMHGKSPSTIKNKISHLRVFMSLVDGSKCQLNHPRVVRALEGFDRNKSYIPNIKQPIHPQVFSEILFALKFDKLSTVVRACLLVLYHGALRQSELLPRSVGSWDPSIQPVRGDCKVFNDHIQIFIKTGKNMKRAGQHRLVTLLKSKSMPLCPVRALCQHFTDTPTYYSSDPLVMFPDTQAPVPSSFLVSNLHGLLRYCGHENLVKSASLHSLRKSAATNAFAEGCSELSIRNFGGWSSDAYKVYISTQNTQVTKSLLASVEKGHK